MHSKVQAMHSKVQAKTAEPNPIDLLFCAVNSSGPNDAQFNRIRQVAPTCPHGRTHWRHLANTIEQSGYDGDAPCVKLL